MKDKLELVNKIEQQLVELNKEYREAITDYLKSIGLEEGTNFKKFNKFGDILSCQVIRSKGDNHLRYLTGGRLNEFNYQKLKKIITESEV